MSKRVNLEETLEEYTRMSGTKSAAAVTRDNPDGSDHPAAKPPDNLTVNPEQGERGRENDDDVRSAIAGSVNDAVPPDTGEEGSKATEFLNAPVTQSGEDKQHFKTHADDPGTESPADVSVEKTAEAIEAAVGKFGRGRVAGVLAKDALDFLTGAVKPADGENKSGAVTTEPAADKTKSAAAGAAQAGEDIPVEAEFAEFMKQAAIEAVHDAIAAGTAWGEHWQAWRAKQAELAAGGGEEEVPPENAEPSPEELAGVGAASEELPPEALAELLAMVGGGGMDGGLDGGLGGGLGDGGLGDLGADPEAAAIISEILDQAGITPEEAMGIEANATALDPEGAPEEKAAYLKQAAAGLRAAGLFRERDPLKNIQKRAAVIRRDAVARGVQEYIAKAAYIVHRRRENAAPAKS